MGLNWDIKDFFTSGFCFGQALKKTDQKQIKTVLVLFLFDLPTGEHTGLQRIGSGRCRSLSARDPER